MNNKKIQHYEFKNIITCTKFYDKKKMAYLNLRRYTNIS